MDFPVLRISKILSEFGGRVYEFHEEEIPDYGWGRVSLRDFDEEYPRFVDVDRDGFVTALIHHCPSLPESARYVWQSRISKPPLVPMACPRCKYRQQNRSRRSANDLR